jgi:Bifunctional DNA primase/polymerase, N-terminal/AAA domain
VNEEPVTLAVHYTDRGVPALPVALRWNEDKGCIAKRPLTSNGHRGASENAGTVRRLFREVRPVDKPVGEGRNLGTDEIVGVGVWPGPAGYLILDPDVKNGATGDTQLAELEERYGELPETVRATTASGGGQIWLRKPDDQTIGSTTLAKDIDVRSNNGFSVAPGTTTPWGDWTFDGPSFLAPTNAPVGNAPRWVLDRLIERATAETCDADPAADIDLDALPEKLHALLDEQPVPGIRSDRIYHFCCVGIECELDDPTILAALAHFPPAVDKGDVLRHGRLAIARARERANDKKTAADELDESWRPVDLGPALAGDIDRPEPTILRRDDQVGLIYTGRVNGFHGDSGVGKSFAALVAAKLEIEADRHVIWIDLEDPDPMTVIGRLCDDFGVNAELIRELFHYYGPTEPFGEPPLAEIERAIAEHEPTMIVIDSTGEAFGLEGLDENKDVEVGPWMRRVPRRLADAGPGVLLLDHSTKANDNPLHPSGSKRKRAAITGASYLIEARTPLTKEAGGILKLTCAKDRHGAHKSGTVAAEIELTRYPDGGMTVHIWAPSAEEAGKDPKIYLAAKAAVDAARDAARPLTQNSLLELMTIKARLSLKRAGIEAAVARHALRVDDGPRNAQLHTYVRDLTAADKEYLLA